MQCSFSNGGQYFAATTGNIILVYSTWTFEIMGTLKGHNGKVKSISWNKDDSRLVSAGTDGAVYTWDLTAYKRDSENILKSCSYTSAVCSPDGKTIYAVGSDKMLKVTKSDFTTLNQSSIIYYIGNVRFSHCSRN
jgi:WD40 repeat protein